MVTIKLSETAPTIHTATPKQASQIIAYYKWLVSTNRQILPFFVYPEDPKKLPPLVLVLVPGSGIVRYDNKEVIIDNAEYNETAPTPYNPDIKPPFSITEILPLIKEYNEMPEKPNYPQERQDI